MEKSLFDELPEVAAFYSPEARALSVQAGDPTRRPMYEGDDVADWMVAHYDIEGCFVALWVFDSDQALRPFVDGVRARHRRANGLQPTEVAEVYEGSFRSMYPAAPSPEPAAAWAKVSPKGAAKPPPAGDYFADIPDLVARYIPKTQTLTLQAGLVVEIAESEAVARQLVAHYNAEKSLVALDILDAETTLRPFLDAVLPAEQPQPANPG